MDTEKLLKLNELKEKGAISEEEFQLMKKEILEENSVEEEDEDDSDYEEETTSASNSFSLGKIILGIFGIIFIAGIINGINNADESGNTSKSQLEDDFDDEGVNADLIEMFDEKKENEYSFNQKYNNRELTFKAKVYGINPECYIKNIWASEREYIPCVELAHPTQDIQMFGLKTALANAKMQDEKVISTLKKNQKIKLTCTLGKNSFDLVFFVFENCRIYEKKVKVNVNSSSQNTARTPSNSGYASNNLINADWWKTATFEDVKAEIDKGANVNAKNDNEETPLHLAAYQNNPKIIELLVENGADINAKGCFSEMTPLMIAAQNSDNPAVIEAMVKYGADVNEKNMGDLSAVDYAAYKNKNPAILETLFRYGGNINDETLSWAQENENPDIKVIVRKHLQ